MQERKRRLVPVLRVLVQERKGRLVPVLRVLVQERKGRLVPVLRVLVQERKGRLVPVLRVLVKVACYKNGMPRYVAVDLGSNSVRMLAAEVDDAGTRVLAEERQVTRLGEGVFRDGAIEEGAIGFLLAQLARYSGIYGRLDVSGVRAVATSAVRDANNQADFLRRASDVLGVEVEVISGSEEARLVHLGVQSLWPRPDERTLTIDVGGGSAELIVSEGRHLTDSVSKPCGAVRLTELFLKHDPPEPPELSRLNSFIAEKLGDFHGRHGRAAFDRAIATSASAAAIVCAIHEIPRSKRDEADRQMVSVAGLRRLFSQLSQSTLAQRRKMTGIGPRRAEIIVAGAAVFLQTLEIFGQPSIFYSSAGVREGIIADLAERGVGRELTRLSADARALMEDMALRYRVKRGHSAQVAFLATQLFDILQPVHKLPPTAGKLLEAAAYLHDIGHFVSNTSHHKHSAYLVSNSDLPGFNDSEREAIAALCRFHRKSVPQPRNSYFDSLHPETRRLVVALTPLLRLADSLDRSHQAKIQRIRGTARETLQLLVESTTGIDLELWAAAEASKLFRDTFGRSLQIVRAERQTA